MKTTPNMNGTQGNNFPILIALQGGGSHGALAWGVLDHLLDVARFEMAAISGTSAGAMNAAMLAAGLATSGTQRARDHLAAFLESRLPARHLLSDSTHWICAALG